MYDMKMEPEMRKDFSTPKMEAPEYPHGLRICLEKKELEKLGFMKAPEIDKMMELKGKVKVVEVSNQDYGQGDEYRVELQITDMELSSEKKDEGPAKVLYGE